MAVADGLVNVLLAFWPRVVMAAMHTTMIRASMTAYSTAVGPSSFAMNLTTLLINLRMGVVLSLKPVSRNELPGNALLGGCPARICLAGRTVRPARSNDARGQAPHGAAASRKASEAWAASEAGEYQPQLEAEPIVLPTSGERAVGVLAEGGDGGDAHHDDQGQHDRVFDRGRAVFLR